MEDKKIIDITQQYKYAVEARDKLTDNYYKWMSYYYLANAGVLVAITQLAKDSEADNWAIFTLGIIGIFICLLWHLSCKGYYYWSNSWINIIKRFENYMFSLNQQGERDFQQGVYSVFSNEIVDEEKGINYFIPNKGANISTPKLTLIFSWFSMVAWLIFTGYMFFKQETELPCGCKWFLLITIGAIFLCLPYLSQHIIKSRKNGDHILVKKHGNSAI